MADFPEEESGNASVPTGRQEAAFQDIRYSERRWKPPDGRYRRSLGARPVSFLSMEGGQDGR
jgi:hypothetical protein